MLKLNMAVIHIRVQWWRWDAHLAYVTFYVNPANIDFLEYPHTKRKLANICDGLIPVNVGFDVKDAYFKLDLAKHFALEYESRFQI